GVVAQGVLPVRGLPAPRHGCFGRRHRAGPGGSAADAHRAALAPFNAQHVPPRRAHALAARGDPRARWPGRRLALAILPVRSVLARGTARVPAHALRTATDPARVSVTRCAGSVNTSNAQT